MPPPSARPAPAAPIVLSASRRGMRCVIVRSLDDGVIRSTSSPVFAALPSDWRPIMRRLSPVALSFLALTLGACSSPTPPAPAASIAKTTNEGFLNQWRGGQDARELARTWYLTPQGSHLLDFDVFMSIPSASDQALRFSDRANLESYGFLYLDDYDTGGLPIGVVKDRRGEGYAPLAKHAQDLTRDYVGLTCAACHTGDLRYNGERFLINAGQGNIDF